MAGRPIKSALVRRQYRVGLCPKMKNHPLCGWIFILLYKHNIICKYHLFAENNIAIGNSIRGLSSRHAKRDTLPSGKGFLESRARTESFYRKYHCNNIRDLCILKPSPVGEGVEAVGE